MADYFSIAFLACIPGIVFGQIVDVTRNAPVYGDKKPSFYGYGGIPSSDNGQLTPRTDVYQGGIDTPVARYDDSYGKGDSYGGGGGGGYGGSGGGDYGDSGPNIVKDYFDDTAASSNATPITKPPPPVFVRTPWFMPNAFYGHWGGVVYMSPYYFAGIYDPPKQIPNYDAKVSYGDGYGIDAWYASRGQGNYKAIAYDNQALDNPDGSGLSQQANSGGWDGAGQLPGPYSVQARDSTNKIPDEYMKQYAALAARPEGDNNKQLSDDAVAISARVGTERETGQNVPPEYMQQYASPSTSGSANLASYGDSTRRRRRRK